MQHNHFDPAAVTCIKTEVKQRLATGRGGPLQSSATQGCLKTFAFLRKRPLLPPWLVLGNVIGT